MSKNSRQDPPSPPKRSPAMERFLASRESGAAPAPAPRKDAADSRSDEPADSRPSGSDDSRPGDSAELRPEESGATSQAWELESLRARFAKAQEDLSLLRGVSESHQRLLSLLDADAELLVAGDPRRLPARVLQIALELTGAERAAYFRPDSSGALKASLVRPEGTEFNTISRSVVRDALVERRSVVHQGRASLEGMERQSILDLDLETVVATPLIARDRLLGVLYLDGTLPGRFGSADVPVLEVFCRLAAAAMLRVKELQTARAENRQLGDENRELKSALGQKASFGGILSASPGMQRVVEQLQRMCRYRSTVRIYGETGTGKELIARALHYESPWSGQSFVAINCAAIPETLLEAELFGFEKGAFTGADQTKPGLFEEADGGTLFLDEIGDMPPSLQVKLLRVLENGEIRRLGGREERHVDVRVIAATHTRLEEKVADGDFRDDLFYRLNVLSLDLPPLRERPEDVAVLAEHFLAEYSRKLGLPRPALGPGALQRLQSQYWPGNVRQLEKCIERSLALWDGDGVLEEQQIMLDAELPGMRPQGPEPSPVEEDLRQFLARMERDKIVAALERSGGKVTAAARSLGISRQYLHRKIKDLDLK